MIAIHVIYYQDDAKCHQTIVMKICKQENTTVHNRLTRTTYVVASVPQQYNPRTVLCLSAEKNGVCKLSRKMCDVIKSQTAYVIIN